MARIESAYFGDDTGMTNITESLRKKVSGRKLDVTANSELIPVFEKAPETRLEVEDEQRIREAAIKACGEADQQCLESTKAKLRQEKLQEKERLNMSSANIVKGRRLTVNVRDANGKRRTLIAPDGQKVTVDDIEGGDTTTLNGVPVPSGKFISEQFGKLGSAFFLALVQTFGLTAFLMMIRDEAPLFWLKVLEGGWVSVFGGGFVCLILLALPFAPLTLVMLFYLFKGIYAEFKKK